MCNSAIQKNLFFAFTCLFLFTSESRSGFAQSSPVLTKFNGTAYNNQVYLSWEIGQGSTCNGIGVMRSVDSVSFVEIGSIEGVCGSTSEPQSYTFTDLTPQSNRTNYYRLNLGGLAFSSVLKIHVQQIGESGYEIRQNASTGNQVFLFENPSHQKRQFELFSVSGKLVFSQSGTDDFFEIETKSLGSGVYFFSISGREDARIISGKTIVAD
ncbi:MAG: T9SS type A sorting domain-containing protein [Bacteroidetes bacterium]|nr:T9SS type A sorting domain-containing protein [Bacteroidota bacterium]